jgi:hypothetical protein
VHIKAAAWTYRQPLTEYFTGSPSYPQDRTWQSSEYVLTGKKQKVTVTVPGVMCGQWDVYANTTGVSIPQVLTKPGKGNGETTYLSDYSKGPASYGHTSIGANGCAPAPTSAPGNEEKQDCDALHTRTVTTTTPYVFTGRKWVPGKPVVSHGEWVKVRDTTSEEKETRGCAKPDRPAPIITPTAETRQDCFTVESRTVTTTVDYVWSHEKWEWIKAAPVVTEGAWTTVRDTTPAERAELGCVQPVAPVIEQSEACDTQGRASITQVEGLDYLISGEVVNDETARVVGGQYVIEGPVTGTLTVISQEGYTNIGEETFVIDLPAAEECPAPAPVVEKPEPVVVTPPRTAAPAPTTQALAPRPTTQAAAPASAPTTKAPATGSASATPTTDELAYTGSQTGSLALGAAILIALGGALTFTRRLMRVHGRHD